MGAEDITIEQLMDDIFAACGLEEMRPGEFTTSMYARRHNVDDKTARGHIHRMIKLGLIEQADHEAIVDGKRAKYVYRKATHEG